MSKTMIAVRAALMMMFASQMLSACASSNGGGGCNPLVSNCGDGGTGALDARADTSTACRAPTPTPRNMDGRNQPAFAMCGQCTSATAGNFVACDPVRSSSCSFTGNNAVGMPRCLCGQNDECAPGLRCAPSGNTFVCIGGDASVPDGGVVTGGGTLCGAVQCQAPGLTGAGQSCCNVNGVPTCVNNTATNCGCGVTCNGGQACVAGLLGALTGGAPGIGDLGGSVCCGMPFSLGPISFPVALCPPEFPSFGDGGFPGLGDGGLPF